jgi:hypothetical protein
MKIQKVKKFYKFLVSKLQKIILEFKVNTYEDLLNMISNSKVIKENLEININNIKNKITEKKEELNLIEKFNKNNKINTQSEDLIFTVNK